MGIKATLDKAAIDITAGERKIIAGLLKKYLPNTTVWAYGSRVKWNARPYSDLDLVAFASDEQKSKVYDLKEAFEESNLPYSVDIFIWDKVPENFRKNIKAEYAVVQDDGEKRDDTVAGWRKVKFGDCAELVHETVSPSEVKDALYIGLEHIGENTLSLLGHGVASDVTSAKLCFQQGAILFGKLRPYFRKVIKAPFNGICSTDIWVVKPFDGIDRGFLFYLMASQEFVDLATQGSDGTRMPRAKWQFVSQIESALPPLPEQRAIAHILGTLDDKIELNRRMNETLEGMARALFKSWFIDFDPVHAKAALNNHSPLESGASQSADDNDKGENNHSPLEGGASQSADDSDRGVNNHSPLEGGASQSADDNDRGENNHSPLEGESASQGQSPQASRWGDDNYRGVNNHSPLEEGYSLPLRRQGASQGQSPQASRWGDIKRQYTQSNLNLAKALRQNSTDAENTLWHYLRKKQLAGRKFRRQQPIGNYIVDFVCTSDNLVIELDGGHHTQQTNLDANREKLLQDKGYRVLRYWNNQVISDCYAVLEDIYNHLCFPSHQSSATTLDSAIPPQGDDSPPTGESAGFALDSPTPPQGGSNGIAERDTAGGSNWTVERAKQYLAHMDAETAALFPSTFGKDGLPEGWEVKAIGDVVQVLGGGTPSTKETKFWSSGKHAFCTPKDMTNLESHILLNTARRITDDGVAQISSEQLPAGSVLLSSRAPIGYLAISEIPVSINQGIIAMICEYPLSNIYMLLWARNNLNTIKANANGSVFPEISKKNFRPIPILVPDKKIIHQFHQISHFWFKKIIKNMKESSALANQRDTLLPKLISGEVRVQ